MVQCAPAAFKFRVTQFCTASGKEDLLFSAII